MQINIFKGTYIIYNLNILRGVDYLSCPKKFKFLFKFYLICKLLIKIIS